LNSGRHSICRTRPLSIHRTTSAGLSVGLPFRSNAGILFLIASSFAHRRPPPTNHSRPIVVDSVWPRFRLGIESDHAEVGPRFTPDVIARSVSLRRWDSSHGHRDGKAACSPHREFERVRMFCRDCCSVPSRNKGQPANFTCGRELHGSRHRGLFAKQRRDGDRVHFD
jgi:hypothetical protein